jgi:hypothetical protein
MYSQKVKEACKIIAEHIVEDRTGGIPPWPIAFAERDLYAKEFFPKELYETVKELVEKELNDEEIARLFKNPSRLAHFLYPLVVFPIENLKPEETAWVIEKIIDYISVFRKGDIFCRDGRNIIWSESEVKDRLNEFKLVDIKEQKNKRAVGRLDTLLFSLEEMIHMGIPAYAHEYHGPYFLNGKLIIVKEHYDLKPVEIWPFIHEFPFSNITTVEIFKGGKVRFDFFDHIETSFSLPEEIEAYGIIIDGNKISDLSVIDDLSRQCLEMINKCNELIKEFNKKDWLRKGMELYSYYLKPAKEVLGKDWRPPSSAFSLLEENSEKLFKKFIKKRGESLELSDKEAVERLQQIFLKNIYKKGGD